jgi:hypothetical protein
VTTVAAGKRPQGVAGASGTVYVANSADGTVTLLSAATGKAIGEPRGVAALKSAAARRTVAISVAHQANSATVVFRIAFSGGGLTSRDVVVADGRIRTGAARLLVWKGGVQTRVRTSRAGGATLRLGSAAARLVLALNASAKAFTSVKTSLDRGGTRLVVTLQRAPVSVTPPSPTPTPPSPSPSPTPPSPSPTPPSPSPSPTPPPPPPPPPPPEIG